MFSHLATTLSIILLKPWSIMYIVISWKTEKQETNAWLLLLLMLLWFHFAVILMMIPFSFALIFGLSIPFFLLVISCFFHVCIFEWYGILSVSFFFCFLFLFYFLNLFCHFHLFGCFLTFFVQLTLRSVCLRIQWVLFTFLESSISTHRVCALEGVGLGVSTLYNNSNNCVFTICSVHSRFIYGKQIYKYIIYKKNAILF